jgi:hypothetical protein
MTLTPTQTKILTAAAEHPDRRVDFDGLKGGARAKVQEALTNHGLIWIGESGDWAITHTGLRAVGIEPKASDATDRILNTVAECAAAQHPSNDRATDAKVAARARASARDKAAAAVTKRAAKAAVAAAEPMGDVSIADAQAMVDAANADEPTPPCRPARPGSKLERLIAMLHRHEGATIEEFMVELEWQRHTIRGAISGNLRKKMGLDVQLIDGRYRIADA